MLIIPKCVIGARAKNGTAPLYPGGVFDVDDALAKRLVAQETAEFAEISARPARAASIPSENPPESVNAPEGLTEGENAIDLEAMSFMELKLKAQSMGIETGKLRSKTALIEAITATENPGDDDFPDLTPQDVIEE
jgi:hypothetical protein